MRMTAIGVLVCLLGVGPLGAQEPYPGLTIVSLRTTNESYLLDNDFNVVRAWHGADVPAEIAYMLPDSSVLRPCRVPLAEGRGGRIQRIDADDVVTWDFLYATDDHLQHHDIEPMPNGNVLLVAWERRTVAEAIQAGRQLVDVDMKVTAIVEIEPVGPTGGNVVWEWRAWDHLVQEADPALDNYGVVADHPELIDINYGEVSGGTWLHTNAVDYNPDLDQIVISARNTGEVYVIDHGTTTAEAAGHTGGRRGRGGDILYRWGNPRVYGRGEAADQVLLGAHGVVWIDAGLPGAGDIMVFNNGDSPDPLENFSSVEEIVPPQSAPGEYVIDPGQPFGPAAAVWRYGDVAGFFSRYQGGAYRLPNGNTLICEGMEGRIFEVTPEGTTVWVFLAGAAVHRAPRYWDDASAATQPPPAARLVGNHPNPFNPTTFITFAIERREHVTIDILDAGFGPGVHTVTWSGRDTANRSAPSGTYLVRMVTGSDDEVRKISLVR